MASFLAKIGVKPAAIYHSGKKRIRQTAEILGVKSVEEDGLNPNDDPSVWGRRLGCLRQDVMVIISAPSISSDVFVAGGGPPMFS